MFKKILMSLMVTAAFGIPTAYAHGIQQQPALLSTVATVGSHGSIANVAATVASPSSLANISANVLDNTVKANVAVAPAPAPSYHAPATSSVADVKANVLNGAITANVAVGQTTHHDDSLLNLNASVLTGGVGNHW